MISIELTESQKPLLAELNGIIDKIETQMKISIDGTEGEEVAYHLMRRIELQQYEPRIIELATIIYDHCRGCAFEEAMLNNRVSTAKADLQRKWFDGKLAKWSALYAKSERIINSLDRSIEGLRSVLSREKELIKSNVTR